ncbi:alanine racemase [Phenylobacterium sp.]|uniref:alanine racemase n=1 Tax=Phenylobacterium sp. TaxID=1871053 RepID=UPI002731A6E4|nr:alanine racemase [Phenylobacterium sp.]MDP2213704.1 alanine racemase [Phenylobacterium sp.]
MAPSSRARLSIDLDALAHNYHAIAAEAAGAETAPVVKADGYGLSAGPIARRLWAEGARTFFVARLAEGEALRRELDHRAARILVLDGFTAECGPRLCASDLMPVLNSVEQVAAAIAFAAGLDAPLPCALQADTGMNRQGLAPGQAQALAGSGGLAGLTVDLVMSHLGSGAIPDHPRNRQQLAAFREIRALFPAAQASLAASAGAFLGPDYRFDLVRPGISLYGGGPTERPDPRLRAVARLEAPILDIRQLSAGDYVGYGTTIQTDHATRVALVGAGYADGVIRASRRSGQAWAAGALRRLYIVDMDLTVVDLGDGEAAPGDMVELLGPHALLDDLAHAAGSIAHECLVRLSSRAQRIYLGSEATQTA